MKRIILFLVTVLFLGVVSTTHLFAKVADTREILFRAGNDAEDLRSAQPVYGSIDGNTIYLTFLDVSNVPTISIIDQVGNVVSTEIYQSSRTIPILVNQKAGEYKIQISIGGECFVGSFELK